MNNLTKVVPIDQMDKRALTLHLRAMHSHYGYDSKTTVERLTSAHESLHRAVEEQGGWEAFLARRVAAGYTDNTNVVPHEHVEGFTPEEQASIEQARADLGADLDLDKPLSSSERKLLHQLVDNDYASLRTDLQSKGYAVLLERRAEIAAEFQEKRAKASVYQDQAKAFYDACDRQIETLTKQAEVDGIELRGAHRYNTDTTVKVTGEQDALRKLDGEWQAAQQRAKTVMDAQRLAAHRKIDLAGITPEAKALLSSIPTAKELLGDIAPALTEGNSPEPPKMRLSNNA